jgi:hypothetical protein
MSTLPQAIWPRDLGDDKFQDVRLVGHAQTDALASEVLPGAIGTLFQTPSSGDRCVPRAACGKKSRRQAVAIALIQEAESAAATLILMGVSIRPSEAMLLGETANRLLEESESSLLFVAS